MFLSGPVRALTWTQSLILWKDLKMAVHGWSPTWQSLKGSAEKKIWQKIHKSRCAKLVTSYPSRLEAVNALTEYWVKGVNTYVNMIFKFFLFNKLFKQCIKSSFCFVIMGHWVLIDEGKNYLNYFSKRLQLNKMWKRWKGLNTFWMQCSRFCTVQLAHGRSQISHPLRSQTVWRVKMKADVKQAKDHVTPKPPKVKRPCLGQESLCWKSTQYWSMNIKVRLIQELGLLFCFSVLFGNFLFLKSKKRHRIFFCF